MRQITVTSARENIYQLLRDLKSHPRETILLTNCRDEECKGVLVSESYFRELLRKAEETAIEVDTSSKDLREANLTSDVRGRD